jgi:hypothetical protein
VEIGDKRQHKQGIERFICSYRGKRTTNLYRQEVVADFKTSDGTHLPNRKQIDQLGLCAQFEVTERGK